MSIKDDAFFVAIGIVVLVGAAWYAKKKLTEAGDAAAQAVSDGVDWVAGNAKAAVPYINPADSSNVVNSSVEWVGKQITKSDGWSVGGQIYDWTH